SDADLLLYGVQRGRQFRDLRFIGVVHALDLAFQLDEPRIHRVERRPVGVRLVPQPHCQSNHSSTNNFWSDHVLSTSTGETMHSAYREREVFCFCGLQMALGVLRTRKPGNPWRKS